MEALFASPWAMVAGALLVSSPIIIHLINRIRYRRIRWAAMEFLLKAQKRMKRKLILQQLILLALRCLLIVLLGLLVSRFTGLNFGGSENRATAHLVILDDTPSMADGWRGNDGKTTDSFDEAKRVLTEQIATAASDATTAQTLEVLRLSDLGTSRPFGRVNTASIREMETYLAGFRPVTVRTPLPLALKKAKEILDSQSGDVSKVVHVLSDFRAVDWADDGEAIKQAITDLKDARIKVYLIDVAHPYRKQEDRRAPNAHDNLSITELSPAKLVVARYDPIEFTLRVRNNGSAEMKDVRFAVKVNGDENKGRSVTIPTIPGNQERSVKFEIPFDRIGTEDKPLDRFSLVTASLDTGEPGGLVADNVRHAVVEVRERLPILFVEGRPKLRETKDGDGFYLRPVFGNVLGGFAVLDGTPRDLETGDLSKFSFVLLLNVPNLPDAAVKNLENYARSGGGIGVFLGPDVIAKDYNQFLFRNGEGFFPVPLADQPSKELTEDELQARRFRISQKKLLLRDPSKRNHPALAGLYTDERGESVKDVEQLERVFGFISFKRYWPVPRIGGKWREDKTVSELYCLPNEQPMADFEAPARKVADGLPVEDPQFSKYKDILGALRGELRRIAISSEPLYKLAGILDDLLADQRGEGNENEALLREFWTSPKMSDLKTEAQRLRDGVKFGDPLYIARDFGRGRVTVVTTTAGETWTDWPTEKPGSASFTPIIKEMGNFLSGAGADENRIVGMPLELKFDTGRYKTTVKRAFATHDPFAPVAKGATAEPVAAVDLKDQQMLAEGDKLVLRFAENTNPGGYYFTFTGLKALGSNATDVSEVPEYRGVAANLDPREGDLHRASRDDILQLAPESQLQSADDAGWTKALRNRKSDLSEYAFLFLIILLVLMVEQGLSTLFSYHNAPGDLTGAAPSVAAVVKGA